MRSRKNTEPAGKRAVHPTVRRALATLGIVLRPPTFVLSSDGAKALDAACTKQLGIPSMLLMERVSLEAATWVRCLVGRESAPVLVVCGPGNNGGDGYAVARHLVVAGVEVAVLALSPPSVRAGDVALQRSILRKMSVPVVATKAGSVGATVRKMTRQLGCPGVVVDALFGTGLTRPVAGIAGELARAINAIRRERTVVVAVDVPSGLDSDTGEPPRGGEAVLADLTLTVEGWKRGFVNPSSVQYTGEVVPIPLGVPRGFAERFGEPPPGLDAIRLINRPAGAARPRD